MTFSFYHSLCTVPTDMRQVASIFQFNWWQTLNWIEVPHAAIGLIWNSMMSMAGGWFFPDDQRGVLCWVTMISALFPALGLT